MVVSESRINKALDALALAEEDYATYRHWLIEMETVPVADADREKFILYMRGRVDQLERVIKSGDSMANVPMRKLLPDGIKGIDVTLGNFKRLYETQR